MQTYLNIAQVVVSVALILIIMFQVRGGGLGGYIRPAQYRVSDQAGGGKDLIPAYHCPG